jgi:nucleoside phosphorylase
MDNNIYSRLVTKLLKVPGMDDYTVRTSLILNIPYHQQLARHNQDARADVIYIVNGLAEMRFSDGTWSLLTFIDNALARVPPGTSLSTQLQDLRHLLEDEQTIPLLSSPPVSTHAPSRQAQLTMVDNAFSKENNPADSKADILLVTVAEVEAKAILSFFPKPKLSHIGDQTYHDFGMIGGASTFMVQSEQGPGGQSGAILTIQEGITALHPSAVIMVGIAFGVNEEKQHIGDILISKQIMDYDLQRIGTDTDSKFVIIPRGDRPSASPRMLSRFRAAANYWETPPKVRFGLILSGAKLVDNQDFRDQLLKFEAGTIGGEMEGGGLYAVAQRKKVDWILVKAICDWGDGHKKQGESQRQKEAAENAARFTLYVIEKGGFIDSKPSAPQYNDTPNAEKLKVQNRMEEVLDSDSTHPRNSSPVQVDHHIQPNMSLDLLDQFSRGNGILFIGAGLSAGAGLPGWVKLVRPLAQSVSYDLPAEDKFITTDHLLSAAQRYENQRGRNSLVQYLLDNLDTTSIQLTSVHRLITSLPVRIIFTTNYDDLIERSLREAERRLNVIISEPELAFWSEDRIQIIKLGGDLRRPESIVLTKQDFNTYFAIRPRLSERLRTTLESKTALFLGYSLQDPFFNQIWDNIGLDFGRYRLRGYAVMFNAQPLEIDDLRQRSIQVINLETKGRDRTMILADWLRGLIQ